MKVWQEARALLTGHPDPAYVEECITELMHKATEHPGKVFTKHFGFRNAASVIVPDPARIPSQPTALDRNRDEGS